MPRHIVPLLGVGLRCVSASAILQVELELCLVYAGVLLPRVDILIGKLGIDAVMDSLALSGPHVPALLLQHLGCIA